MMVSDRVFSWLVGIVVCLLLLTAGCAPVVEQAGVPQVEPRIPEVPKEEAAGPQAEPVPQAVPAGPVTLALKFAEGDSATYRVVSEARQSVEWEGDFENQGAFKGGHNQRRFEMAFTRQIQSVDEKGNAIAKITIEELKYLSLQKDQTTEDFDSTREADRSNPLSGLIGRSYTIEITPAGRVSRVVNAGDVRDAVEDNSPARRTVSTLFRRDVIMERHTILALPVAEASELNTGDNWSSTKVFSFGLMGSKSYEKVYTLKEVKDADNRKVVVVEMNAIPTSEMAERLHKEQGPDDYSEMFDSAEAYTGRLELDLTTGKVEEFSEELQLEWVVANPAAEQRDSTEPIALIMGVTRSHSLERID